MVAAIALVVANVRDNHINDLAKAVRRRKAREVFLLRSLLAYVAAIEPILFIARLHVIADDNFCAALRFNRVLYRVKVILRFELDAAYYHDAHALIIPRCQCRLSQRKTNHHR